MTAQSFPIRLNEEWRVAFDPLQWVLEKYQGNKWRARSFCVTKAALLRCIREYCGAADIGEVLNLPDWHPDRCVVTATEASTLPDLPGEAVSGLWPVLKAACPISEAAEKGGGA